MGKFIRHTNVNEAKVIQVMQIKSIVGDGTSRPVVEIIEYYSLDGELLARQGIETLNLGHWKGGDNHEPGN